jgi:hypothetical protein
MKISLWFKCSHSDPFSLDFRNDVVTARLSAEKLLAKAVQGEIASVMLDRENEAGIIFMTSEELPELFLAVKSDEDVRPAIDRGLKNAFCRDGYEVFVYTNGSITGPTIATMVRVVPAA